MPIEVEEPHIEKKRTLHRPNCSTSFPIWTQRRKRKNQYKQAMPVSRGIRKCKCIPTTKLHFE